VHCTLSDLLSVSYLSLGFIRSDKHSVNLLLKDKRMQIQSKHVRVVVANVLNLLPV
jgi:hypothetical protein